MKWFLPQNELERRECLQRCGPSETACDEFFDDLVWLGARTCGTPIATISFIDESRESFKVKFGLTLAEVPREDSFTAHAILQSDITVVSDAFEHPQLARTSLARLHGIRFYAGFPLVCEEGHALGAFSLMDYIPRILTRDQLQTIRILARRAAAQLFRRYPEFGNDIVPWTGNGNVLGACALVRDATGDQSKKTEQNNSDVTVCRMRQVPAVIWTTDLDLRITSVYGAALSDIGWDGKTTIGTTVFQQFSTEDRLAAPIFAHCRALAGESAQFTFTADAKSFAVRVDALRDNEERLIGCIGTALAMDELQSNSPTPSSDYHDSQAQQAMTERSIATQSADPRPETILLVEDDEALRRLLYVSLAKAGYRVLTATDGAHAMKLCQSFPGTIHLVISDIIMPQLNGLELRAQLALCRPDLRVLLMSGYSQEELSRQDLSAEGIGFLEKPFRPEELVNRVRELLTAQAVA